MYMINCKYGLHGPLEALTREAFEVFIHGIPQCEALRSQPWGEDKYLDHCLQLLGIRRVLAYELLDEIACGDIPADCGPRGFFVLLCRCIARVHCTSLACRTQGPCPQQRSSRATPQGVCSRLA